MKHFLVWGQQLKDRLVRVQEAILCIFIHWKFFSWMRLFIWKDFIERRLVCQKLSPQWSEQQGIQHGSKQGTLSMKKARPRIYLSLWLLHFSEKEIRVGRPENYDHRRVSSHLSPTPPPFPLSLSHNTVSQECSSPSRQIHWVHISIPDIYELTNG